MAGLAFTMADLPDGLMLQPRQFAGVRKPEWEIVHRSSGLKIIDGCQSRADALEVAVALGGIDWTRDRYAIAADSVARAVFLDVQAEVNHRATMAGRRAS